MGTDFGLRGRAVRRFVFIVRREGETIGKWKWMERKGLESFRLDAVMRLGGADGETGSACAGFCFDHNFDVVAECGEKAHESLHGEAFQFVVQQS